MGNIEHDAIRIFTTITGFINDAGGFRKDFGNKITAAMINKIINTKKIAQYLFVILIVAIAGCNSSSKDGKTNAANKQLYRCPMHHEIVKDKPGTCPICGMDLVPFGGEEKAISDVNLNTLLRPTNSYVISTIPVTTVQQNEEQIEVEALGTVQYDTRAIGSISSRVSGPIEKLYLKYTFQDISKGQRVMDIYSPELLTAQQNLLFLIKNDPGNTSFINAAKEKLLLLGMSNEQLQQVIQSQNPSFTVPVYSNYSGHIHDALNMNNVTSSVNSTEPVLTKELILKEGMYVQKGQTLLSIYNPHKLWAVLNIYADNQNLVKVGNSVLIIPETANEKNFRAKIDFIEPFFREGSKTLTARVYFTNNEMNMPVGSQVKATIFANKIKADWLPKDAVISLGLDKIVFKKYGNVFKAIKIKTGTTYNNKVQVL
ncbi:MAG TPA: efflux RND transporter periplasmic adaptor subunit, partial [Chitinophagaceae bacterium]|nr:efflux RND transporter periplasmic adaptor subunit [Chitinophagaceae bacterium]